jgi:molybdate transport system ATP-binding protein
VGDPAARAAGRDVTELSVELPLARFALRADVRLAGRVTAIMGPSGSGKTSLLEVVAGLRRRARGRVIVDGAVLLDSAAGVNLPPERRRTGYVPQDAGLFPHLSVRGNVEFGGRRDATRIRALIDMLGIEPLLSRAPITLSGGERQRVALARALAADPRLLLLDEPLASVDVELRERILPWLLRVRDEWQVPILYVTHNVGEALALADEALLLRAGSVEAQGPAASLLTSPVVAREAEAGIENLLQGRVTEHDAAGGVSRVTIEGGAVLAVPLTADPPGAPVILAIRAEDVLVATEPVHGVSARNLLAAHVVTVDRIGRDMLLRCELTAGGRPWLVRLTPSAVDSLALAPGGAAWLAVKSHSIRVL